MEDFIFCAVKDMGELRKDFEKLEADLAISRSVNTKPRYRIISLECHYGSNNHYQKGGSRTKNITDLWKIKSDRRFIKVEDCHWLQSNGNK